MKYSKEEIEYAIEKSWQKFKKNPNYKISSRNKNKALFYVWQNNLPIHLSFDEYLESLAEEKNTRNFKLRVALKRENINKLFRGDIK